MLKKFNQKGFAPILLILLAAAGVVAYLLVSSSASFKNTLFANLYPKEQSLAAANREGAFNNLSADLTENSATFYFSYTGSAPKGYTVDVATSADMKQNLLRKFGQGSLPPIIVSNPQGKYSQYRCNTFLYWRINVGNTSIRSSVLNTKVNCNIGTGTTSPTFTPTPTPTGIGGTAPTSTPISTATPTPTSTPTSSCTPQTKPTTLSLQGSDGTWCYDSDGNGNFTTSGYCVDNCSYKADYCEDVTATGTNRDGYCTGTWNGTSWAQVHCEFGGYVCPSFGQVCSNGACTTNNTGTGTTAP